MDHDRIFTVKDAATYVQVSRITIYRLLNQGQFPGHKVGGSWRVSQRALDAWMLREWPTPL